jgi:hypothetical protein
VVEQGSNTGREPGGWELHRGIERIEKAIREQSANFVPIGVYNIAMQNVTDQLAELKSENASLESELKAQATAKAKQDEDLRKTKAQQWFAIGSVVLAGVIGFASTMISSVINQGTP